MDKGKSVFAGGSLIMPALFAERKEYYGVTSIKLNSSNIPKTKADIESLWNQYFPEYAFTHFSNSSPDLPLPL